MPTLPLTQDQIDADLALPDDGPGQQPEPQAKAKAPKAKKPAPQGKGGGWRKIEQDEIDRRLAEIAAIIGPDPDKPQSRPQLPVARPAAKAASAPPPVTPAAAQIEDEVTNPDVDFVSTPPAGLEVLSRQLTAQAHPSDKLSNFQDRLMASGVKRPELTLEPEGADDQADQAEVTEVKPSERRGGGSRKGVPNRWTGKMRDALAQSFEEMGGVVYLNTLAFEYPQTYAAMLMKMMPTQLAAETNDPVFRTVSEFLKSLGDSARQPVQFEGKAE